MLRRTNRCGGKKLQDAGLDANISRGVERTVIGAIGDERKLTEEMFTPLPGVESAMHIVKQYKLYPVNRIPEYGNRYQWHSAGRQPDQIIAGPCSVETQQQMDCPPSTLAKQVAA